jgi:hypothetical protein
MAAEAIGQLAAAIPAVVLGPTVIDRVLGLLGEHADRARKVVGRFIAAVPEAAKRFRIAAVEALVGQPDLSSAVINFGSGSGAVRLSAGQSRHFAVGAGAKAINAHLTGTMADEQITYRFDQDDDGIEFRAGSRNLDLEYCVLIIDAVPAPDSRTTSGRVTPEGQPRVWVLVLEKIGRHQVGGRIQIPRNELPQPAPYGVRLTPRMVS